MAKKSQIDKAIDELIERREAVHSKVRFEIASIDAAIEVLKGQRKASRPRAAKTATAPQA